MTRATTHEGQSQPVRVEVQGPVAWITLDVPPVNALGRGARSRLREALSRLAEEAGVRVVVLAGAGEKAFSAGQDLRELAALPPEESAAFAAEWDALYAQVRGFPRPVIAAISGAAMGGGLELALNCDLRVAAAGATLAVTAANLNLVTSLYSLARNLPDALARELFFTARPLPAAEALRLGLVNRVVPLERLRDEVTALAEEVARRPPQSLAEGKRLLAAARDMNRDEHDRLQQAAFARLRLTPEHHAAVMAFFQK